MKRVFLPHRSETLLRHRVVFQRFIEEVVSFPFESLLRFPQESYGVMTAFCTAPPILDSSERGVIFGSI